jgi:hypothetical protein
MGALPTHETRGRADDPPPQSTASIPGIWLTDREPGELLGLRRVVVYLRDSDPIVIAEVPTRQDAAELAEQVLARIDKAAAKGSWAELGDRLVRPEVILSVDVEHAA